MGLLFRALSVPCLLLNLGSAAFSQQAGADTDMALLQVNLGAVLVVQDFFADGDAGQCNGAAHDRIISQASSWSPAIRIDTDSRSGGCQYSIGFVDFNGALKASGFGLTMSFTADGDAGQCGNQGSFPVPISPDLTNLKMTPRIRMDMDNRSGGCAEKWSVSGKKVLFDMKFYGDGDVGQCGNTGNHTAPPEFSIRLDTDDRPGGCTQSLRLRAAGHAFE